VVVAEVLCDRDIVHWLRVGYDLSVWRPDPDFVGDQVRWFQRCPPFAFRRLDYAEVLAEFASTVT
jgi:hypothetical protein